jgi:hypothetical protein
MIVLNIGLHCLVYSPDRIDVQPALTDVEKAILRAVLTTSGLTISALAIELGASYANTYAMVYRLKYRGLLSLYQNGHHGCQLSALAEWLDGDE